MFEITINIHKQIILLCWFSVFLVHCSNIQTEPPASSSTNTEILNSPEIVTQTIAVQTGAQNEPMSAATLTVEITRTIAPVSETLYLDASVTPIVFSASYRNLGQTQTLPNSGLFALSLDGEITPLLTDIDMDFRSPSWSDDCSQLAFLQSFENEAGETLHNIALMDSSGNIEPIVSSPARKTAPTWSPDNVSVTYSESDGNSSQIVTSSLTTQESIHLTNNGWNLWPDWSPDGNQLLFVFRQGDYDGAIYVLHLDNGEQVQILPSTWGSFTVEDPGRFSPSVPKWSPTGNQIAFTIIESPDTGIEYARIYVMNSDGSEVRPITNQAPKDPYVDPLFSEILLTWSPDGQSVLYSRSQLGSETGTGHNELCLADVVNGESSCFASEENLSYSSADWCSN